jgi:hypothetical protein
MRAFALLLLSHFKQGFLNFYFLFNFVMQLRSSGDHHPSING